MLTPADSQFHLAPRDVVWVAGPLAVLMIAAELSYYWRYGRRPAARTGRFRWAAAMAAVLLPGSTALVWMVPLAAFFIIAAILTIWTFHSYGRTTSPISPATRAACIGLRLAALGLLVLYLLRPTVSVSQVKFDKALLFVLYDTSRSMTIDDAGGRARTRMDAVREAVGESAERLAAVTRFFDLRQFTFDEVRSEKPLDGNPPDLPASPAGEGTAIGRAMQSACQTAGGQKIHGLIVVSDGAANSDGDEMDAVRVAERLARQSPPVPVWTVGVGRDVEPDKADVIARRLDLAAKKVPAFNVLNVHAVFELVKLNGRPVKVELLLGHGAKAEVVDSRMITATRDEPERIAVELKAIPKATGFQEVTVRLSPEEKVDGRLLAGDHSQLTEDIQVVDDLMNVLYVEGKFRTEARELSATLAGADLLRLERHYVLRSAALDGADGQQLPRTDAEWNRYHVIILGDVRADAFTGEQLRNLRKIVREGGKGLLMIGGADAFGQGGWADSPLADTFPFDLRQARGQLPDKFRISPTDIGLREQVMRLDDDPDANRRLWADMPAMQGANSFPTAEQVRQTRPGAAVLATTETGQPVIVAAQAGRGRTLAVAFDTTLRWRFHLDNGRELHNRFWRQAVLWLANREGNVWVKTRQLRYRLSKLRQVGGAAAEKIVVTAGLEDQTGRQVRDPNAKLTQVMPPDATGKSERIVRPMRYVGDHYEAELPPPPVDGMYQLVFEGTLDGKAVKAETGFLVESPNVELGRRMADFDRLRRISAATDAGRFATIDGFGELLGQFKSSDYVVQRVEPGQPIDLGDAYRTPLLLAVVVLLMAEWVIRKRRSLV